MRQVRTVAMALALLLATGGLTVFAQTQTPGAGTGQGQGQGGEWAHGQHRMGPGMHNRGEFMANYLNLTDAQRAAAKTIFDTAKQNAQPVKQQLKTLHTQLEQAIKANNNQAIQTTANQMAPLIAQLITIKSTAFAQMYQQLTPDQRTKAEQLKGRFMHHGMMGGGPGWGPGRRAPAPQGQGQQAPAPAPQNP